DKESLGTLAAKLGRRSRGAADQLRRTGAAHGGGSAAGGGGAAGGLLGGGCGRRLGLWRRGSGGGKRQNSINSFRFDSKRIKVCNSDAIRDLKPDEHHI